MRMDESKWSGWALTVNGNSFFLTTELIRDVSPGLLEPGVVFREYLEWKPHLSYGQIMLLFKKNSMEEMVVLLHEMKREVVRMYRVRNI